MFSVQLLESATSAFANNYELGWNKPGGGGATPTGAVDNKEFFQTESDATGNIAYRGTPSSSKK